MTTATTTPTGTVQALHARRQALAEQLEHKRAEASRVRERIARMIAEGAAASTDAAAAVPLALEIEGISNAIALLDADIAEAQRADMERRRAEALHDVAMGHDAALAALTEQEAWVGEVAAELWSRLEALTYALQAAYQAENRARDIGAQLPRVSPLQQFEGRNSALHQLGQLLRVMIREASPDAGYHGQQAREE